MAMDFKTAGARVRSLIAAKKPQQLSRSALEPDALRDNVVGEAIDESPRFRSLMGESPTVEYDAEQPDGSTERKSFQWDTFGEAVRDVARAGYSWREPEVLGRDQVRPSHLFNREMVSQALLSPEFADSRPYTIENAPESLMGARLCADALIEKASDVAEHLERAQRMNEAEQQIDTAQQMIDQLREQGKAQADEIFGPDPDLAKQMREQIAKREQARGQLAGLLDEHKASNASQAAREMAQAAVAAHSEGVKAARALASLPGMEPGSAHNRTPGQQIELAERLSGMKKLREIAELVGRMRFDMRAKRQTRTRDVKIEPVGITTGRDVTQLLPHEYARMQVPGLRALWLNDWSNHALLQWQMGGKTPADKGPAVYVFDGSGSMGTFNRIEWASAVGLATLGLIHGEKRDFAAVQFGSASEVKSWVFPAREDPDPDTVIDFATHFFRGGTSILAGLTEAKRIIDEVPAFKSADVIIATDGICRYADADQQLVAALGDMGVRIHGISIAVEGENRYLKQACEYVVDLEDLVLDGPNAATDALANNLT